MDMVGVESVVLAKSAPSRLEAALARQTPSAKAGLSALLASTKPKRPPAPQIACVLLARQLALLAQS